MGVWLPVALISCRVQEVPIALISDRVGSKVGEESFVQVSWPRNTRSNFLYICILQTNIAMDTMTDQSITLPLAAHVCATYVAKQLHIA